MTFLHALYSIRAMVEIEKYNNSILNKIDKEPNLFGKGNWKENYYLKIKLLDWAAEKNSYSTLETTLVSHIESLVKKQCESGNKTTIEEFEKSLFLPKSDGCIDAEDVLKRLQIPIIFD